MRVDLISREARRLRFEAVLVGRAPYIVPVIVLAAAALIGILVKDTARMFTAALEAAVPLAAGIFAASLVASESSLEIQLSSPDGFRPAGLRRLGLIFGLSALCCLVGWLVASITGGLSGWQPDRGPVAAQLIWLPSLVSFTLVGCLAGLASRSRSVANSAIALLWVGCNFFHAAFRTWPWLPYVFPFMTTYEPQAGDWLPTRLVLLAVDLAALAAVWIWLGAEEWLLSSEDRS